MGSEILKYIRPVLDIRMLKMTTDRKRIARSITSAFRPLSGLIQTTLLLMREGFRSASLRFKIAFSWLPCWPAPLLPSVLLQSRS